MDKPKASRPKRLQSLIERFDRKLFDKNEPNKKKVIKLFFSLNFGLQMAWSAGCWKIEILDHFDFSPARRLQVG